MSQIAALLVMFFNTDEDAFWGLHQLMVNEKYNMHAHMLYFRSVLFIPKLDNTQAIMEKSEANFQLCMAFFPANWRNEHALPCHGPHFISWKSNTSDARNKFKWLKNVPFSEE